MRFWWIADTSRLAAEREAVESLASETAWFELGRWRIWEGCLSLEGTIAAHGHTYPIRLVYPDQFPLVPAWVEPQSDVRWSRHQYGNSTLCLELRPDNWDSRATGADVLCSAFHLVEIEDPLGDTGTAAPSAHDVGEVQSYGWHGNPVMIGEGCLERLRAKKAVDLKALSWSSEGIWPLLLHDQTDRSGAQRPPDGDIEHWRFDRPLVVSYSSAPEGDLDRSEVVGAGGWDAEITAWAQTITSAVAVFVGGDKVEVFNLIEEGRTFRRKVLVLPDEKGTRSARIIGASKQRVILVGCGSVGSKLAESVVRSGITTLTLIDGDIFLPVNLERHVLDWDDIGFKKAGALKRRLLNIVPGAKINAIEDNLNWQRSAKTHAWQVDLISRGAVIVDASGDPATGLFLAAIAEANGRPFVSAQVYEGGIGALIASCIPGRDPPFLEGKARFKAWCEAEGKPPPKSGERRYEMLTGDGVPVVADDAAVTMTAGHAARVVLNILDGNPPPASAAWLLVGYAQGWVFDDHGHTIRLDMGERRPEAPQPMDEAARDFVNRLFEELGHEADATQ